MEEASLLAALGSWPGARWLHASGTAYLFVNATHILGIALLLGPILLLDARLLGFARTVPLAVIAPLLVRTAAGGLALALLTGLWLFTVNPVEYIANPAFLTKLALLALAVINIGVQHANPGYRRALSSDVVPGGVKAAAAASAGLWLCVLVAGRWIGFV